MANTNPSAPRVEELPFPRVGHVHLRVADLDRAIAFYEGALGFSVEVRGPDAAFLGAGGYHHHVGLNTWQSKGASPPPPGHTGLYHAAFLYPDRPSLAAAVRRALDAGAPLQGASDHGVSEAVYLADPDGNGVELYRDRPPQEWPRDEAGGITLITDPLDLDALLSEAPTC